MIEEVEREVKCHGSWPTDFVADVNAARASLQQMGHVQNEPILILSKPLYRLMKKEVPIHVPDFPDCKNYLDFVEEVGLVSNIVEDWGKDNTKAFMFGITFHGEYLDLKPHIAKVIITDIIT